MNKNVLLALLVVFAAAPGLSGCASTFSREAMNLVNRDISFRQLQSAPDSFKGSWIMLGGVILETRNTPEGSTIEVLQRPLDRQGRPRETDDTEGRFIIESPQFLDAAVYHEGKRISLVGLLSGQEVRPLGGIHYRYPVVAAKELQLWEPRSSPQFSFGVGIGVFHRF